MKFETPLCINYLDKLNNQNERCFFASAFEEQIRQFGTRVDYQVKNYSETSANLQSGDDITNPYDSPVSLRMMINVTNDAVMLSRFGIIADSDLVALVAIASFQTVFGSAARPKNGDLIKLTEFGADRPDGLDGPIYEVTEVLDEFLQGQNILQGHYIWQLKAKRFQYSFEPNVKPEARSGALFDNARWGMEPGFTSPVSAVETKQDGEKYTDMEAMQNLAGIGGNAENNPYGGYISHAAVSSPSVSAIRYWGSTTAGRLTTTTANLLNKTTAVSGPTHLFTMSVRDSYIYYAVHDPITATFSVNGTLSMWTASPVVISGEQFNVYRSPSKLTGTFTIRAST